MPATTRSKTQPAQTKSKDKGEISTAKSAAKRKAPNTKSPPSKKAKTGKSDVKAKKPPATKKLSNADDDTEDIKDAKQELMHNAAAQKETTDSSESVTINRAPVLELWSACVASLVHPDLSWETCLSIGGAISTITAISKGRSIGAIDKPDPGHQAAKQEKRKKATRDAEEVHVMQFNLKLKDRTALVGEKPKKVNEESLRKKFGDAYDGVKQTMLDALKGWEGKEDELNDKAFHMYEDFRPTVAPGQRGWGRKGDLNMETLKTAVSKA